MPSSNQNLAPDQAQEHWIVACTADEVDDEFGTRVPIDGDRAIAVFRVEGTYYATDDRCTHGEASLCEGMVEGGVVECPFHNGTFDIATGKALSFPCVINLATYPVRVEGDRILVQIDAPTTLPSPYKP